MTDSITLTGLVATPPRHLVTNEGLHITSFRLASTQRRYDRGSQKWIDGETNWFTVTCFRQLAVNAVTSIQKGQRIVVTGKLRVRDWTSGDRTGTTIEVDAEALGHDIAWGSSVFTRSVVAAAHDTETDAPSDRAAALDDTSEASDEPIPTDVAGELADARSTQPLEAALPF